MCVEDGPPPADAAIDQSGIDVRCGELRGPSIALLFSATNLTWNQDRAIRP
jgi:hypothetical protein